MGNKPEIDLDFIITIKGGPGSGNWSHAGRPGKRGGSSAGGGLLKNPKALGRYRATAGSEATRKQAQRLRDANREAIDERKNRAKENPKSRESRVLDLIKRQEAKLSELVDTFDNLLSNNARTGHGGTPNITDNSKGRAQARAWEKHEERLRSLNRQIEAQKEKIERTKKKLLPVESTKKSAKFTRKNPISDGLLSLAKAKKVKQWDKNPHIFFVVGLNKVALTTFDGKVGVNSRYPAKTPAEWAICKELIQEANGN